MRVGSVRSSILSTFRTIVLAVLCTGALSIIVAEAQEPPTLERRITRALPPDSFASPSDVEVGPDGALYAAYPADGELLVLDPSTDSTRRIGAQPEGIENFPRRLWWNPDGLWGTDWDTSRLVRLDGPQENPATVGVVLPGRAGEVRSRGLLGVVASDRLIVQTTASALAMALANPGRRSWRDSLPPPLVPSELIDRLPVWITHPAGSVADTLVVLSTERRLGLLAPPPSVDSDPDPAFGIVEEPFGDPPLLGIDPTASHVVVVDRTVQEDDPDPIFSIVWMDARGDTLRHRDFPYTPVPNYDDWIEDAIRAELERFDLSSSEAVAWAREQLFTPAWLPPASRVLVGSEGWLWVQREPIPGATHLRWDLFDPGGERFGRLRVPAHLSIRAVGGRTGWATRSDVEQSGLWRIEAIQP